jgi:hypothetical protein
MEGMGMNLKPAINRMSFLTNGLRVAEGKGESDRHGITPWDAVLLRFAAAAEILETDFWVQYNELGDSDLTHDCKYPLDGLAALVLFLPRRFQPSWYRQAG